MLNKTGFDSFHINATISSSPHPDPVSKATKETVIKLVAIPVQPLRLSTRQQAGGGSTARSPDQSWKGSEYNGVYFRAVKPERV